MELLTTINSNIKKKLPLNRITMMMTNNLTLKMNKRRRMKILTIMREKITKKTRSNDYNQQLQTKFIIRGSIGEGSIELIYLEKGFVMKK
jgi:hypothetical protein